MTRRSPAARARPALPAAAVPAELPATLEPELATLVGAPPAGEWIYEIKLDGYRMLARVGDAGEVRLVTRRGNDWTHRFGALRRALVAAKLPPGWYDGEIVLLDEAGKPSFNGLQNAIEGGRNDAIVYYLFDVPHCAGHDLRRVPVEERRALLQSLLRESDRLRFSQEIVADAGAILQSACRLGLEGVIGKRRGSLYVQRRSDDWIKLKCTQRQEFVIGGFTRPDDARPNGIGALLVGTWQDGELHYAGKVGTGYTGEVSAALRQRLEAMAVRKRPFAGPTGHDRHATWVRPDLVCEVTYNEWPEGGSLRHAAFKGLREDKAAPAVQRERAAPQLRKVTHGSRMIDPSTGLAKRDLVRYYVEVAPWMLPHLQGRPAYIRRAPVGIGGPMVFLQHPEGLRGLRGTDPALWPGHDPAIAFDTVDDLFAAAQVGMVEVHTWNSTARAIAQPDRLVFDLDPGEDVPWPQVQEAAVLVRTLLQELGLQSWLKTTGGKGLHLWVPIAPAWDYDTAKGFSEAVVLHMARTIPQRFVARSGPRNRVGRVFIDYLRNGWVQSTAEAYSARARPGLGVSMPLAWEDLPRVRGADHWNIANAIEHLAQRREDPWAAYRTSPQDLGAAMQRLGFTPAGTKPARRRAAARRNAAA